MKTTFKMKALVFMIPTLIAASLMFTYESINTEKRIIREEIIKRAEAVTSLATKTGELPILSGNLELLRSTVESLRENAEVSSVTFYDSRRKRLIDSGLPVSSPLPPILPTQPTYMVDEKDSLVFFAPVYTTKANDDFDLIREDPDTKPTKENIGWIRLGFSKAFMRKNEETIVARGVFLAAVFIAISGILAYFLIDAATRPLGQIVRIAEDIARGDLSREIKVDRQDEIGALARAFDTMKNAIRQVLQETSGIISSVQSGRLDTRGHAEAFEGGWRELVSGVNNLTEAFAKVTEELRHSNESLEGRVEARTAELAAANAALVAEIAERKHAEVALQRSEDQYRSIFENAIEGIFQTTIEGRFLTASPSLARMLGYDSADDLVSSLTDLRRDLYLRPEERERLLLRIEADGFVSGFETQLRRKDGTVLWVEISARIVPGRVAPAACLDGFLIDITARKAAEAEQTRLEAQLLHSQKMEALGTLVGGISHDFNNLLQAIGGNNELLLMGKDESHPDFEKLSVMQRASDRATELVRRLLLFGRKASVNLEVTNLNGVVHNVVSLLQRTFPKWIAIELKLASEMRDLLADSGQLELMLVNLMTNSVDSMRHGGTILVETENFWVSEQYRNKYIELPAGKYVLLKVSDTGHGIDEKTRERIFEPFFTTKEIGKGTGLGLATVYGIVQGHHGHIACYSEPGVGTTFKVFLPADPVSASEEKPTATVARTTRGTETILLVEDELILRSLAEEALSHFGYTVLKSQSGEEALELYGKQGDGIDLILLDLGMPGMGGERCLGELLKLNPGVKVIVASGYSAHPMAREPEERGAAAFLCKPFQISEMAATVRAVLDRQ